MARRLATALVKWLWKIIKLFRFTFNF